MPAELDTGLSLYEINKQIIKNEKPLDTIAIGVKCAEIAEYFHDNEYVMLLCRERFDYSVFHITGEATVSHLTNEIRETIMNRGFVVSIEQQSNGSYEIWIRDSETEEDFVYYMFDYSFGIIEV